MVKHSPLAEVIDLALSLSKVTTDAVRYQILRNHPHGIRICTWTEDGWEEVFTGEDLDKVVDNLREALS